MSLTDKISNHGSFLTHKPTSFRFLNTRILVTICQIILVIFLAHQLALITWQIIPEKNNNATMPAFGRSLSSIQKQSIQSDALAQLDSLHLFGQPPKVQQIAAPAPEAVPVSRLAVKITGLVASTIPENSLAIIRSGSTDSTYRPGDTLKGTQARIESIYPDRVIIRNGVRFESLLMYPDEAQKKPQALATFSHQRPQQQKVSVSNDLRKRLQEKPSSWTEIVSISPVREGGEVRGYRINPSRHPKAFEQLGLKPNDMAVAINGYDLTNTSEALKIISQLPTLDQVSLTIERDGQRFEVDLSS